MLLCLNKWKHDFNLRFNNSIFFCSSPQSAICLISPFWLTKINTCINVGRRWNFDKSITSSSRCRMLISHCKNVLCVFTCLSTCFRFVTPLITILFRNYNKSIITQIDTLYSRLSKIFFIKVLKYILIFSWIKNHNFSVLLYFASSLRKCLLLLEISTYSKWPQNDRNSF